MMGGGSFLRALLLDRAMTSALLNFSSASLAA